MNPRAFLAIALLISIFSTVAAQEEGWLTDALHTAKIRLGLSDQQAKDLRPVIEKRIRTLRKLNDPSGTDALWDELRKSRRDFETGLKRHLTAAQLRIVPELQAELENEALARLADKQIDLITKRLNLSADQAGRVHPVLERNFNDKVELLRRYRANQPDDRTSFNKALALINEDTEAELKQILDEKQIGEFRQVTGQSKDRAGWLWGAVPAMDDSGNSGSIDSTAKSKPKRGEFVIAPIPVINPTLENGLALGVGYLYHLDKDDLTSPPSITGIGAFRTSNGSRGAVLAQKFVLERNKYRLLMAVGRADIHFNFFGIGADAGNAGRSVPIEVEGRGLLIDASMRVFARNWFAGLRYYAMRSTINIDRANVTPPGQLPVPDIPQIPEIDLNLRTAGLGPTLEFDSRSDPFYPRAGEQFRFQAGFNGRAVGGKRTYQTYQTFYNKYYSLSPRQVVAAHVAGCYATGSVPFYDLCFLGKSKDIRGYEVGQYIDRVMIASQAEYRLELPKRLGAAMFFGVGEVARRFGDLRTDALKPGGGVGLRFRLTKQNHINLRVDYAWGINSKGLYLGVTEAF
jgi:surface antigen Omp85-like protein